MAQGYNFGVDPEEVVLTLVGFASQHEIFNLMALDSASDLGWVAYGFGLIGFLMLMLLPASWNFKTIASWFMLFLIVIIRPLGEAAFFSDAAAVAQSALDSPVCISGQTDTQECRDIHAAQGNGGDGDRSVTRVEDLVGAQRMLLNESDDVLSFKVYTPEAAAIDVINDLNYGLAIGLNNLGPRALERHFSSIEAIRRAATSDTPTAYNISEFLATCGRKVPGAAEVAYMRSADIQEQNQDLWNDLGSTKITAADGVLLYQNYANYVRGMEPAESLMLYPSLVCDPDACGGNNAYNEGRLSRRIEERQFRNALRPILFTPSGYEAMSSDVQSAIGLTDADRANLAGRTLIKQQEIGDTLNDLNRSLGTLGDNAFTLLDQQTVSMVIPMNVTAAEYNDMESSEELGIHNHDFVERNKGDVARIGGGCAAGAVAGGIFGGPLGAIAGCVIGGVGMAIFANDGDNSNINQDMNLRPIAGDDDPGYVVSNCQQFHRVIDVRNALSTSRSAQFGVDFAELEDQYPAAFDNNDPEFSALPPRAQTHTVLTTALGLVNSRCQRMYSYSSRGVRQSNTDAVNQCIEEENQRINSMIVLNRNLIAEQSHPAAQAMVQSAAEPQFQGPVRNIAAWLGERAAPIGVAVKSAIGGFGAGTYSKIMPMVVTYATVIMIILTPLIYMVGLAVPSWSFGILFMPLVVIVYFQLTKVVFTMIGVINGIFLATNDQNVLSGNMINFADLVMGFAYTSAFILTGFFMFALKNPVGAIQQVAGTADKTSTISGAEAIGMALGAAKLAKTVVAGPKALASGIGAAKGAASAAQSGGGLMGALSNVGEVTKAGLGGMMRPQGEGSDLGQVMEDAQHKEMAKISDREYMSERRKKMTMGDYRARSAGRLQKEEEGQLKDEARAMGASSLFQPQKGVSTFGGKDYDTTGDSIAEDAMSRFRKAGYDVADAMRGVLSQARDPETGKVDKAKLNEIVHIDKTAKTERGAAEAVWSTSALKNAGLDPSKLGGKMSDDGKSVRFEILPGKEPGTGAPDVRPPKTD